jgi:hypothetical protein
MNNRIPLTTKKKCRRSIWIKCPFLVDLMCGDFVCGNYGDGEGRPVSLDGVSRCRQCLSIFPDRIVMTNLKGGKK